MTVLPEPQEKATFVQQSFARIAGGYDRTNQVMTFGMDRAWREFAVRAVAPPFNGRALDVGTGTGDFLPLLAPWLPQGIAVGIDFCLPMMQTGVYKIAGLDGTGNPATAGPPADGPTAPGRPGIRPGAAGFVAGDALCLPFADNTFDAITTGFLMRNVTDIPAALREMWRVARPGAALACLEVARPRNPLLRLGHQLYFEWIVPYLGGILNNDVSFYTYLPQSASYMPPPDEFAALLRAAGWSYVTYTLLGMGAVAVHVGGKN